MKELMWHIISAQSMPPEDTLIIKIMEVLPATPMLVLWEMSTAFTQGNRVLGTPVLEIRFHYKPSMDTTNPLIHWFLLAFLACPVNIIVGTHN